MPMRQIATLGVRVLSHVEKWPTILYLCLRFNVPFLCYMCMKITNKPALADAHLS